MKVKQFSVLHPNSTVGVVAVSSPSEAGRFQKGLEELRRSGLTVKVAGDPTAEYGKKAFLFASASPSARAEALHSLLGDPSVIAIFAARGAYGSAEVLPLLDRKLVGSSGKPLVGFSDVTALLNFWVDCGAPAVHGCNVDAAWTLASEKPESRRSTDALLALLRGQPQGAIQGTVLRAGPSVKGALVGGSLMTLGSLCGTPWQLTKRGTLLFLEETHERPYRIHRVLLQLAQSGALDAIRGLVIGDMIDCVHATGAGPTWEEVVCSVAETRNLPVLHIAGYGHGAVNLPLALGAEVALDGSTLRYDP